MLEPQFHGGRLRFRICVNLPSAVNILMVWKQFWNVVEMRDPLTLVQRIRCLVGWHGAALRSWWSGFAPPSTPLLSAVRGHSCPTGTNCRILMERGAPPQTGRLGPIPLAVDCVLSKMSAAAQTPGGFWRRRAPR